MVDLAREISGHRTHIGVRILASYRHLRLLCRDKFVVSQFIHGGCPHAEIVELLAHVPTASSRVFAHRESWITADNAHIGLVGEPHRASMSRQRQLFFESTPRSLQN